AFVREKVRVHTDPPRRREVLMTMKPMKWTACLITAFLTAMLGVVGYLRGGVQTSAKVDFVTQIQPILKENCYACHGPEKQKGKLRLDSRELSLAGGGSGPAIVPGHGNESYLVKRIK